MASLHTLPRDLLRHWSAVYLSDCDAHAMRRVCRLWHAIVPAERLQACGLYRDAATHGYVHRLEWLFCVERVPLRSDAARLCEAAASHGQLHALQWLVACGVRCSVEAVIAAACGGHLHVQRWLRDAVPSLGVATREECVGAAQGGHLATLQYAYLTASPDGRDTGLLQQCLYCMLGQHDFVAGDAFAWLRPCMPSLIDQYMYALPCDSAARIGQLASLQRQYPYTERAFADGADAALQMLRDPLWQRCRVRWTQLAAASGHLHVARWCCERFNTADALEPLSGAVLAETVPREQRVDLLQWALQAGLLTGAPALQRLLIDATCLDDLRVLEWAREHTSAECSAALLVHAARHASLDMVRWLYTLTGGDSAAHESAWRVCVKAARSGRLEVLRYVHQCGFPLGALAARAAVKRGHLRVLEYMHSVSPEMLRASNCAVLAFAHGRLAVARMLLLVYPNDAVLRAQMETLRAQRRAALCDPHVLPFLSARTQ